MATPQSDGEESDHAAPEAALVPLGDGYLYDSQSDSILIDGAYIEGITGPLSEVDLH